MLQDFPSPRLSAQYTNLDIFSSFDGSVTKGLGTVVSEGMSTDGQRARMTQDTLPDMSALGDPQETMRRVQAMSNKAKGISGADFVEPAKKRKR